VHAQERYDNEAVRSAADKKCFYDESKIRIQDIEIFRQMKRGLVETISQLEPQSCRTLQRYEIVLVGEATPSHPNQPFILFNAEQTNTWRWSNIDKLALRAAAVWDFSPSHARIWNYRLQTLSTAETSGKAVRGMYVPLHVGLVSTAFSNGAGPADLDLCFFGNMLPRRTAFKRLLKEHTRLSFMFGEFEDKDPRKAECISRARVVMVMHSKEDASASLETHRIDRVMAQGKCVVAEPSVDVEIDEEYSRSGGVYFASLECIPDAVAALSASAGAWRACGLKAKAFMKRKHQASPLLLRDAIAAIAAVSSKVGLVHLRGH
jgi:hypothetical protein